jgi:hypothetical protein
LVAATAIGQAVGSGEPEDAKWLLGRHKVAESLIKALEGASGDHAWEAQKAAHRALETISGVTLVWAESRDGLTEGQRSTIAKWREWAERDAVDFKASDEALAKIESAWRQLEDPRAWRKALEDAKDTWGVAAAAPTARGTAENVPALPAEIAKDATPEEQQALSKARASLRIALERTVGPSLDERKKKYVLTSEEAQSLEVVVHNLGQSGRRGGANRIRKNAATELMTYGLRAIELLKRALESEQVYVRWSAASAIADLAPSVDRDDLHALAFAYELPDRLFLLLDEQAENQAPFVRADAHRALVAISGKSVAWPENVESKSPTPEESEARRQWLTWVTEQGELVRASETLREEHRKALGELERKLASPRGWREALSGVEAAIAKAEKDLKP